LRRWYNRETLEISRHSAAALPANSVAAKDASLIRQEFAERALRGGSVGHRSQRRARKSTLLIRTDCIFPTLYQIRQQGCTPRRGVCHSDVAALFVKFFLVIWRSVPPELAGGNAPGHYRGHSQASVRINHRTTC